MIGCLILSLILIVLFLITLLGLNLISMLTFALLLAGTGGIYYFLISKSLKKSKEQTAKDGTAKPAAAKKPEPKPAPAPTPAAKPAPKPAAPESKPEPAKEDPARWAPKIPLAGPSAPGAEKPAPQTSAPATPKPAAGEPSPIAQPAPAAAETAKTETPAPPKPAVAAQPVIPAPAEPAPQPITQAVKPAPAAPKAVAPQPAAPAPATPKPEPKPATQAQAPEPAPAAPKAVAPQPAAPAPATPKPEPKPVTQAQAPEPAPLAPEPAAAGADPIPVSLGKQLVRVREQALAAAVEALQAHNKRQKHEDKKIQIRSQALAGPADLALTAWQFLAVRNYLAQYPHLTAVAGRDFLDKLRVQALGGQPDLYGEWLQRLSGAKAPAAAALVAREIAALVTGSAVAGPADDIIGRALRTFTDKVTLEAARALGDKRMVTKLTNLLAKSKS